MNRKEREEKKLPQFLQNQSELQNIKMYLHITCYLLLLLKGNGTFSQMRQGYELLLYVRDLGWMDVDGGPAPVTSVPGEEHAW